MKNHTLEESIFQNRFWIALTAVALVAAGVLAYAFFRIVSLEKRLVAVTGDLASSTAALHGITGGISKDLSQLRLETVGISQALTDTREDVSATKGDLSAVKTQVGGVEQAVGTISGSVSTLEKLVATDPELLKKYSKVYFLNENYSPAHLTTIPQNYVYSNTKPESFLSETWPHLQRLLNAAALNNVTLYVRSAYRSYTEQAAVKSQHVFVYGEGTANAFSAEQGYSEHQLGTTVDFTTNGLFGELVDDFDATAAYAWLRQNAHQFGFVLSYPKGNGYYNYEPWHWRFVGVKLATHLREKNMNFYDMDQREIDAYLVNLFD